MHTCLDFIQLSREICYTFLIETLISFIFKYCCGGCFQAALTTVWKVNHGLRVQLRALSFLLPGFSTKSTHTGSSGHSQFGKSCSHLNTAKDYTSVLTSAPASKCPPSTHSSFYITPPAKGTSPASPPKTYNELCSHKVLTPKASSPPSCHIKGKLSRDLMHKLTSISDQPPCSS